VRELNHLTQTGLMNYVLQYMVAGQEERIALVHAPTQKTLVHHYNAGHARDLGPGESLLGSLLNIALKDHKYAEVETVVGPPPRHKGRHSMQAEQTESHVYLG
jgi:hypothetical protein